MIARCTFRYLRDAGFDNVSFDLIAGLPGQTMTGWRRNLEEAFALRPEHLSFYLLEVHQGTPLASHIESGLQPKPDEDLATEMYEVMLDRAAEAGYEHYEISNLCLRDSSRGTTPNTGPQRPTMASAVRRILTMARLAAGE